MSYLKYSLGDIVKEIKLPDSNGVLTDALNSKNIKIIYFYPKDNTKGCTTEALDFTSKVKDFKKYNTVIYGISPDEGKKHFNFIAKNNLKITLLSDTEKKILNEFGVWQKKKLYGKEYMGVIRTTILIDENNKIIKIWEKVNVKNHVEEVLNFIKEMKQ
ncbi:peroxiredoxin Q/BCP [Oceanotoga teriensis]|uniref:thioredoxin-dependent peroxiredoxin n=1 Tax=Oceanotoga teriensis TaxID=515440 RepID=A0AA45C9A6_9BACT|nr:peroxiredoxin [Oceanotoga teriensis]PWJ96562.1 peroxiredoxin Q/BCP [Oceanotoga teriensis]